MNWLEKTLRWIALGGVFLLPFICLIVADNLFFPYITGKNFAFRIIVEISTAAWLSLALVSPKYRPRRSWILAAFSIFVLIVLIADLQGVNVFKSLWSNYERMDGWITLAHLLAYIVVATAMVSTEELWQWVWWENLAVSVFLSLYGLLQVAGVLTLGQGGGAGLSARVDATFGNPIYLAVYMLFNVFIAAMLWQKSWVASRSGERFWPSWGYGAVIVLDTLVLFLTGTRGTMLGIVGGAVLALLIYAFLEGSRRVRTSAVVSIVVVIVLALGLKAAHGTAFVQRIGFLERLSSISLSDATINARFLNMGIAWQGVKERPILGWGQENYAIVFDKYYDPRMYAQEQWFDRVHDIIFDWLIAAGFLGLISYLSIFGATLWALWKKGTAFTTGERSILTGLLAGYFFHNLTVFDNITSYILFGTLLAFIAYRSSVAAPRTVARDLIAESALPYVTLVLALVLWGVAWFLNAGALAQNRTLISALAEGDPAKKLANFETAINYHSFGTQEAREQLSQIASAAAAADIATSVKQQYLDVTAKEMQAQAQASPLDARFPLFLGAVYDAFGDLGDGKAALDRAHELSPRKQTILYEMGQNAFARGDTAGALSDFKTAYELETSNTDALFYYAAALLRTGKDAEANALLAPYIENGQAADQRILAALILRGQYARAAQIWAAHVKAVPNDLQGYVTLAALYYQQGNRAQSIQVLQQAEMVAPSAKSQIDPLIEEIRSGTAQISTK